jgi:UDP-N-acetyl-D-galactosamine dehydrogenase
VGVVGLGYVGLPLAVAFGARGLDTIGFDIDARRIGDLRAGRDSTGSFGPGELVGAELGFADRVEELVDRTCFVVAVPTPATADGHADLTALRKACELIAGVLRPGALVVFESTVYPGATREVCVPILEAGSGLRCGDDFQVGYSPERINPGDRARGLADVVKVVAGYDEAALERVRALYEPVVRAGLHTAPSIEAAELAKLVENSQRDLNIAFVNEIARFCHAAGIPVDAVLDASATKWNFQRFRPGMVGGHCIPVDPHYLIDRVVAVGENPSVLTAARAANAAMPAFIAEQLIRLHPRPRPAIGVLGVTFKADVPDARNSGVGPLVAELRRRTAHVVAHDPLCPPEVARREVGVELVPLEDMKDFDIVVLAVDHRDYLAAASTIGLMARAGGVVADLTASLTPDSLPEHVTLWKL